MIKAKSIEEEIRTSYLEYAMSVIVSRAIPDVRDGLKPVQRRILYAMNELSFTHNNPYKKSARIVGETMGKYHPHGDMAIYDALARMAQEFSLRYPLIDGQGNFGSIDGDEPAAMRYTEARLRELSEQMMVDIDKQTIPFRLNFDGSLEEPEYFPSVVPQLLLNGTSGIAVGMATNMVPHNLREIGNAVIHLVKNPEATLRDLMQFVKGPDFPTGGIAYAGSNLLSAYETGRGKIRTRGELNLSEDRRIVITSLPYEVNKARFVESLANLVKEEVITGISDIRDESDRDGIRIVLKVRDNDARNLIVNQLYERTALEKTHGIINLVLLDNQPRIMGLKELLSVFITHRLDVIKKRSEFDLKKSREREHILDGLEIALSSLDQIIDMIRKALDPKDAKAKLMANFSFSEVQATAILDIRLQRLTSMEVRSVRDELAEIKKKIAELTEIVSDEYRRRDIVVNEMEVLMKKYGDDRRTEIVMGEVEGRNIEDLIPVEESVVILTEGGFVKRVSLEEYRSQKRGGKGTAGASWKDDLITSAVSCTSHDTIYFFTNQGRVLMKKAYQIEKKGRVSGGTYVASLLGLQEGETARVLMNGEQTENGNVVIVTAGGKVKKIAAESIRKVRSTGIRVITLEDGDEVLSVHQITGNAKIFVVSSGARASVFMLDEVRRSGRSSMGVKAIRLKKGEKIISSFPAEDDMYVLSISERALGKRTPVGEFPVHHRGSSGILIYKKSSRSGKLLSVLPVRDDDELLVISTKKIIRVKVNGVRILSRTTSGVKIMDLEKGDTVAIVSRIEPSDQEE